jgi:hypothetical protein
MKERRPPGNKKSASARATGEPEPERGMQKVTKLKEDLEEDLIEALVGARHDGQAVIRGLRRGVLFPHSKGF